MKRNMQKFFGMKFLDHSHLCHMTICELADMGADFNTPLIQSKKAKPHQTCAFSHMKAEQKSTQSLNI